PVLPSFPTRRSSDLPILHDLEERHRDDPLVVIGVHSAKFDAEKDSEHILAAMRRYGVAHPVAVDSEMRIWSEYAVRSWPTLVIIDRKSTRLNSSHQI